MPATHLSPPRQPPRLPPPPTEKNHDQRKHFETHQKSSLHNETTTKFLTKESEVMLMRGAQQGSLNRKY